ncbi:MAG: S4 domain-containing protein [Proteobacteria bacterium]|nr:S4 domain-containing protein [Pseudomonadota bacterium]
MTNAQIDSKTDARVRLDRWLCAARFFKTRQLAKEAVEGGKVHQNGQRAKAAREVTIGQTLEIRRGEEVFTVTIMALAVRRGSAPEARKLYSESADSIELREAERARAAMQRAGLKVPAAKPDKRDRRELKKLKEESETRDSSDF